MSFRPKSSCVVVVAGLMVGLLALPGRSAAEPIAAPPKEDEAKVARYVKELTNKDPLVRKQVAHALGAMGARARTAVPALREALLDTDEDVKAAAASALEKIGSGPARDDRDQLRRALQEAEQQRAELAKILEAAKEKLAEQQSRLAEERAQRLEALAAERDRNKELQDVLKKLEAQRHEARAAAEEAAAEAQRSRAEERRAREQADVQQKKLLDLEKLAAALRDRAVASELAAKSAQERNAALLEQIEALQKEVEKLRAGKKAPPGAPAERNPPPKDIEATVVDVDQESGLLTLSVGSDSGLSKGNTLEVFRLKPEPKYLGTVTVVEVRARDAVAKPVKPLKRGAIQKGDQVASRILGRP
jgi:hypothetical protein